MDYDDLKILVFAARFSELRTDEKGNFAEMKDDITSYQKRMQTRVTG